ncbi:MAG TPA: amino acid permease, partial [Gemmataceae bacterium]|nr:amino acid permease [Gemmataceae bacterium]
MNWKQLLNRKSMETLQREMAGEHRLRRALGPIQLTALAIGAIIGAGIFVMTGAVAKENAGPAVLISFVVAGIGCGLAALCYSEFAAMVPIAGSAYTYAYATLGELFAWIIGWDLILEYAMSCATVAAAWTKYFDAFLRALFGPDHGLPLWMSSDPFSKHGAIFNLPAVCVLAIVTVILVIGIRESATTNAILVGVKLFVVLFVILVGVSFINPQNWTGIPPEKRFGEQANQSQAVTPTQPAKPMSTQEEDNWGLLGAVGLDKQLAPLDEHTRSSFAPFGFSGIMLGAALVFFAYIGFDSISTNAEEAKNPQRDLPIGIISSLVICTVLYILVALVITGMEPYYKIDGEAAIATAFQKKSVEHHSLLLRASAGLIATGALAGMSSVLLVTFLSQARIFLAMARDRLLPHNVFGVIHPKFQTPHRATILTG